MSDGAGLGKPSLGQPGSRQASQSAAITKSVFFPMAVSGFDHLHSRLPKPSHHEVARRLAVASCPEALIHLQKSLLRIVHAILGGWQHVDPILESCLRVLHLQGWQHGLVVAGGQGNGDELYQVPPSCFCHKRSPLS